MGYNITSEEINSIARDMARQPGMILLETRTWLLPVAVVAVDFGWGSCRRWNLIEEFVLRCIASGLTELAVCPGIAGLLHLDAVFIERCLAELLRQRLLVVQREIAGQSFYELTEAGLETCRTGRVPVTPGRESVLIICNAQYEFMDTAGRHMEAADYSGPCWPLFRYHNREEELALRQDFIPAGQEAVRTAQTQMTVWHGDNWPDSVTETLAPRREEDQNRPFGEIWLYDAVHKQVFCRVWDFAGKSFCGQLENVLNSLEAKHRLAQVTQTYNQTTRYQSLLACLAQTGHSPGQLEMLYDREFRTVCLEACADVRELMLLIVPDIAAIAADEEIVQQLRAVTKRQGAVFIGWAGQQPAGRSKETPPAALPAALQNIAGPDGLPGVFFFSLHPRSNCELVIDRQYYLGEAPPWLSYQDKTVMNNTVVAKSTDTGFVTEQGTWLQGQFLKQLEQQLLTGKLMAADHCLNWFCALLRLREHDYIREMLAEEAVEKVIATHSGRTLLTLLTAYCNLGEFGFGFARLLAGVVQQGDNAEIVKWLEKLYLTNPAAYRRIAAMGRTTKRVK